MTRGLERWHETGQKHFVTFSCYQRRPYLRDPRCCAIVLETLEAVRQRFLMDVYGYVLMPEHVHLLMGEPANCLLADAMHFLKLSSSKRIRALRHESGPFWEKRYYDRNLRSYHDFREKLRYTHRNPVKRGLVARPEDWRWSSFRHYVSGVELPVGIESEWTAWFRGGSKIVYPC